MKELKAYNGPMKLIALSLGALLVGQSLARPLLDVRMGLWEVTSTTEMGGVPGVDTSKMPPQQQAQIAAAMKGAMGKPSVLKSCMTREKFVTERTPVDQPGTTCSHTVQTNTAKVLENTMICTGERPSKSVSRTEALSPTAFTGTVTSTSASPGREMSVTIKMTGKWLGADCGTVK